MKRYSGVRTAQAGGLPVYVEDIVDGAPGNRRRLHQYVRHSPDGFQWGYAGSGPSDLALAILWDHFGTEPSSACYLDFKLDHVARWEHVWSIDSVAIAAWLDEWRKGPGDRFATVDDELSFVALGLEFAMYLGGHR